MKELTTTQVSTVISDPDSVDAAIFDEDQVIRAPAHPGGLVGQGKARVGREVEQVRPQHAPQGSVCLRGFACQRHRIRGIHTRQRTADR